MIKALFRGHEIYCMDFYAGWVDIVFRDEASPITGTGRCRCLPEDIMISDTAETEAHND